MHSKLRANLTPAEVTQEEKDYVHTKLLELYGPHLKPTSRDWFTYSNFLEVIRNLNMKSNPGLPLCYSYATIGDYLGYKEGYVPEAKLRELWLLVQQRVIDKCWDPFRVFLKKEPVKKSKIEEGRYRLIFSGSLVDQIIDHLLFDQMNCEEVEKMWEVPSKVGWSPFGISCKKLLDLFRKPICLDKSFWDWSMQGFVAEMDLRFRKEFSDDPLWNELADSRYNYCFKEAEVMLSDGSVYKQQVGGIMKSGLVNTISTNSRAQVMLDLIVRKRLCLKPGLVCAQGDDTIQEEPQQLEEYLKEMAKLGVKTKVEEGTAFCGFELTTKEPIYKEKHLAKMITAEWDNRESFFQSMQLMYAHSPDLDWIQRVVTKLDLKVLHKSVLRAMFDREE